MPEVFYVRAEYGTYAPFFVKGGYVAIGWMDQNDLSAYSSKEALYPLYKKAHTNNKSKKHISSLMANKVNYCPQVARKGE